MINYKKSPQDIEGKIANTCYDLIPINCLKIIPIWIISAIFTSIAISV
jgi:hypothetical protein